MAARGQAMTVEFHAWDTSANAPKTGDAANITLRWIKDGTSAALTTTTVTEVDSTNAKGVYKCDLSSTETDCKLGKLAGVSSTASIAIFGPAITFDQIPVIAPGSSGGLPTVDASNAVKVQSGTGANQISLSSGAVTVGTNNDKTGYTASTVSDKTGYSLTQTFPTNFADLAITATSGQVTVGSFGTGATRLKKNTASQGPIPFGMSLASDNSPATGKTVTVQIAKDGATSFSTATGTVTEAGSGAYWFTPSQADTNCNVGILRFTEADCNDQLEFFFTD